MGIASSAVHQNLACVLAAVVVLLALPGTGRAGEAAQPPVAPAAPQAGATPRGRVFNVADYGAALDGKQDDAPAIRAAFDAMKANGHPFGTLLVPGVARIASTIDLDGGYRNTPSEGQWSAGAGEDFRVYVAGALRPDPGITVAVNLHGARNVWTDIRFDHGGRDGDIGLQVGDLDLADIGVSGTDFAGTLLYADASADKAKRIRSSKVRHVYASNCGRAIYWRGIEAFGTFEFVWDRNCTRGSHFKECADIGIQHYENFSPETHAIGLHFEECNMFSVGVLSFGDRATEALIQITGGDFGSIQRIRTTGRPDRPDGQATTTGLKLVNVKSLNVDNLQTARCRIGLHAIGSTFTIKAHHSLTCDINPLVIEGSEKFPAPRIDIGAQYRYHMRESVKIAKNVIGGVLRLHGAIWLMNIADTRDELYAIDCQSPQMILDVANLTVENRDGLLGSIWHPNPANIRGVAQARLGNTLVHGGLFEGTILPGTTIQNKTERALNLWMPVRYEPKNDAAATCQVFIGPSGDKLTRVEIRERPAGSPAQQESISLRLPPWWWMRVDVQNATVGKVAEYYE